MPVDTSPTASRAGINLPLTTIALGYKQPDYVMKWLFPLVETPTYGGTILRFGDSDPSDEINDDRADAAPYPEVNVGGYDGLPYKLNTKGFSYPLGDKHRQEMENLNINWGALASRGLMKHVGMLHEIEGALIATTVANYATTHRVTLSPGSQLNEAGVDPAIAISAAKSRISSYAMTPPNVAIMGQEVFDALAIKYTRIFTGGNASADAQLLLTEDSLARLLGLRKVGVCRAARRGVPVFGKNLVLAYVPPDALSDEEGLQVYRPRRADLVNIMEPAYGFTYVMVGQPKISNPIRDELRSRTVWKVDFDRQINLTGVDTAGKVTHGYLIANAVA